MKVCRLCKRPRPLGDFYANKGTRDGLLHECKRCHKKVVAREQKLRRYGITQEEYDEMLAAQGGGCAICGMVPEDNGRALDIDHDHACCPDSAKSCGQCVRGLLCRRCNMAIGTYEDNPELLRRAAEYLHLTLS